MQYVFWLFSFFRKSVISDHAKALGDNLQALIFFLLIPSNKILKCLKFNSWNGRYVIFQQVVSSEFLLIGQRPRREFFQRFCSSDSFWEQFAYLPSVAPLFSETRIFFVPLDQFQCPCHCGCLRSVALTPGWGWNFAAPSLLMLMKAGGGAPVGPGWHQAAGTLALSGTNFSFPELPSLVFF